MFRKIAMSGLAAALLLAAGCDPFRHFRREAPSAVPANRLLSGEPRVEDLVAYLNDNARRLQSLECQNVDIDVKAADQQVGLMGSLACQRPRNFRMQARVAGSKQVDLGSNE